MREMFEVIVDKAILRGEHSPAEELCGIGELKSAGKQSKVGALALVKVPTNTRGETLIIPEEHCIFVPPGISRERASYIPALVFCLWAWNELSLELGDIAVLTGSSLISRMAGQVAIWRGACPVMGLHRMQNHVPGIRYPEMDIRDREEMLGWLCQPLKGKSGFAAIDMDGRDWVVDVLLEVLPRWGRLMLAGEAKQSITIDYYNNIHKKGAHIITTRYQPTMIFQSEKWPGVDRHLRRALRILQNEKMAQDLQVAVGDCEPLVFAGNRPAAQRSKV
jgi:hypothetical protein